jgi:hypothetical protein
VGLLLHQAVQQEAEGGNSPKREQDDDLVVDVACAKIYPIFPTNRLIVAKVFKAPR